VDVLGLVPCRPRGRRLQILCIGAHSDDIEIGCGGTVLSLQRQHPDCRIHWMILATTELRRREAIASSKAFISPRSRGEIRIHDLPDGLLPAHFDKVKALFEDLKSAISPDLIFTHHLSDRHQDHSLIGNVTWQTFRDHAIFEYEIPKYEGDLLTPNLYVPLEPAVARRKLSAITRLFKSQHGKTWFTGDNLEAVMRVRGLESRASGGFAEAFHARKLVWQSAGEGADRARTRRKAA